MGRVFGMSDDCTRLGMIVACEKARVQSTADKKQSSRHDEMTDGATASCNFTCRL